MSRLALPIALAAVLALPASASAVKIAGGAVTPSKSRVASVKLTNTEARSLKGTVSLVAGKLKLGKKKVSLRPRATKRFKVKLSKKGMKRLRQKRNLKVTVVTRLKGRTGGFRVTRKKLTLKAPAGSGGGLPGGGQRGGGGTGGGSKPASNLWNARLGDSGAYDDFAFKVEGGKITLTRPALILVTCARTGALSGIAGSSEIFNHEGPWTLGQSVAQTRTGRAVNQYVESGERGISYKLASQRSGNGITGSLTMTFSDSQLVPYWDPYTGVTLYRMGFINCAGTRNFQAVPAG